MSNADEIVAQAKQLHGAGRLTDAEQWYVRALEIDPNLTEVHYLLGAARLALRRLPEAIVSLEHAVRLDPRHADAEHSLGFALSVSNRFDEAATHYRRAIELRPDDPFIRNNLGSVLVSQSKLDEAAECYRQAIALKGDYAQAYCNLGVVFERRGDLSSAMNYYRLALGYQPADADTLARLAEALVRQNNLQEAAGCYARLLETQPDNVAALERLATIVAALGQYDEAARHYARALELRPDLASAHANLGNLLIRQGKLAEGIASHRRAVGLRPSDAGVLQALGKALAAGGQLDEAAATYRRAIELDASCAEALCGLGAVLARQDHLDEAGVFCRRAVELAPAFAEGHYRLGEVLSTDSRFEEARHCFERAIALKPDFAEAHYSLGVLLLLMGHLPEGWIEYEWRWTRRHLAPVLPRPVWTGQELPQGTLLIISEQGFGDTLQLIRYAELIKRRVGRVVVECRPQVAGLIARCRGVDHVLRREEPLVAHDVYAQILSLPYILGTSLDDIPCNVPYLHPDKQLLERWRDELADQPALKVGISWQGSLSNPSDLSRSFPVGCFADIAELPGVQLYSLQSGDGREQLAGFHPRRPIVDLGDRLGDFDNTAAIVRNLDLIITCDSAPAHLAGGLGVPVWVPLARVPDWRWMLDREDSPWYPTMRLFRQQRRGDWADMFRRMAAELTKLAAEAVGSRIAGNRPTSDA